MREEIDFALSYPFEIPRSSFMFTVDQTQSLGEVSDDFRSKLPVLASGSNQSPSQLTRKYKGRSGSGEIPAERAILKNFDVVYAALQGSSHDGLDIRPTGLGVLLVPVSVVTHATKAQDGHR